MAAAQYEIFNNSGEIIRKLYLLDIVTNIDGSQFYVTIEDSSSYVFQGDDVQAVDIQNRMRAKCAFLGVDYGKTGMYITIQVPPPSEEPE